MTGISHAPVRPAAPDRLDAPFVARIVALPWLVSRVLSVAVYLLAAPAVAGRSRFTTVLTAYDAGHYLSIARLGYGPLGVFQPRWAFFPGLPGVIRGLDTFMDGRLGVFVVNQAAFFVALAGVYVIARRHSGARAALLATWATALFPLSFVFSLTYPSSLFLAATVWAFVLVEDRHDVGAGLLAACATLLRPNGLVVGVALAVAVVAARRIVVVCGPSVVVFVGWCLVCLDRTGDALAFLTAKSSWKEITVTGLFSAPGKGSAWPHALLALGAIAIVLVRRGSLPRSWLVFTLLYLVPSFAFGIVGLGRYTNECFPAFVAAGQVLATWKPRLAAGAVGVSAVGLVVMEVAVARYNLVP